MKWKNKDNRGISSKQRETLTQGNRLGKHSNQVSNRRKVQSKSSRTQSKFSLNLNLTKSTTHLTDRVLSRSQSITAECSRKTQTHFLLGNPLQQNHRTKTLLMMELIVLRLTSWLAQEQLIDLIRWLSTWHKTTITSKSTNERGTRS